LKITQGGLGGQVIVTLAEVWQYEKLFWRRFWRNTKKTLAEHLGMETILAFLGFVGGFLVHDQNAVSGFVGALATLGAGAACLIVTNLVTVPAELHNEQTATITGLTKDKGALLEDVKPRLEFVFEAGKEPFEHTEPALMTGKAIRIFRLGIRNDGNQRIENCSVKLWAMSNFMNVFLPMILKQRDDDPPAKQIPMYPTGRTTPLFVAGMRAMSDDYRRTFSLNRYGICRCN
jgi:hypothetical protein